MDCVRKINDKSTGIKFQDNKKPIRRVAQTINRRLFWFVLFVGLFGFASISYFSILFYLKVVDYKMELIHVVHVCHELHMLHEASKSRSSSRVLKNDVVTNEQATTRPEERQVNFTR